MSHQRCTWCDDTGEVYDQIGEWRGACVCAEGRQISSRSSTLWQETLEFYQKEIERLRDLLDAMEQAQRDPGEIWYWQGDGRDDLDSMSSKMIVAIQADQLRQLIFKKDL